MFTTSNVSLLSTSLAVNKPVTVGVSLVALFTPPASVIDVVSISPEMIAASFAPLIVMVTSCVVPSEAVTVNVSVSVSFSLSAWMTG